MNIRIPGSCWNLLAIFPAILLSACAGNPARQTSTAPIPEERNFLTHQGQELFMSGMNLAWIDFGRDLTHFNEDRFLQALDEISEAGGNTIRWWIHVNGSYNPVWNGDEISGMPPGSIEILERALDMAWERGIVVQLCLWSFDMLQPQSLVDLGRNKRFLEDPALIQTYIDNALVPMVENLGDHPAVIAWEIFNEPEGMSTNFGWSRERVSMETIQRFVNLTAGAIHRTNPNAKVTNGTWSFRAQTDRGGFTNYYRDDRLIAAGGDPEGILDFYSVHFYQQHFDDSLSPFHHPASYWGLDKPIAIGEFSAVGIVDFGGGIRTSSKLTPTEAYQYAFENGYAGALAWTWTAHEPEFGSVANVEPAMMQLRFTQRRNIVVDTGPINRLPQRVAELPRLILHVGAETLASPIDLTTIFVDSEDGTALSYELEPIGGPEIAEFTIAGSSLNGRLIPGAYGTTSLTIRAIDSGGKYAMARLDLTVIDPDRGNVALFKPATASTVEGELHSADFVNDGLPTTRYSSAYEDGQWLEIDLEGTFLISSALLNWEAAFGKVYDIQASQDGQTWTTIVSETNGAAGSRLYEFEPLPASFVRLDLKTRGTEWGFSLWELELTGERLPE